MNKRMQKPILGAVFCALIFAATWLQIPTPPVGNINLGDGVLLLCAWWLGGPWGTAAAACGAALCDLSSGYLLYIPATFLIKGGMVAVAVWVRRLASRRTARFSRLLSAVSAEGVMILGYFLYEFLILGLACGFAGYRPGALINLPCNALQALFAVILASLLDTKIKRSSEPVQK